MFHFLFRYCGTFRVSALYGLEALTFELKSVPSVACDLDHLPVNFGLFIVFVAELWAERQMSAETAELSKPGK